MLHCYWNPESDPSRYNEICFFLYNKATDWPRLSCVNHDNSLSELSRYLLKMHQPLRISEPGEHTTCNESKVRERIREEGYRSAELSGI